MITSNREYHFVGILNLKRSRYLSIKSKPVDDKINWLFLKIGERQFSFIYEIEEQDNLSYKKLYKVNISFMLINEVKELIRLGEKYNILRGNKDVGEIKIISVIST